MPVPSASKYQYIVFEEKDIRIVERGKADIKNLRSHDVMPIHYRLERKTYEINFKLDLKSTWPSLFIKALGPKGESAYLEGVHLGQCGGFYDYPYRRKLEGKRLELRYEWSPLFNCPTKKPIAEDMVISFVILDKDGNLLGEEKLPFVLRDNGIYFENGAL